MKIYTPMVCLGLLLLSVLSVGATAQDAGSDLELVSSGAVLTVLVGSWEGTCRTWFQPGKLADESPVRGTISLMPEGQFLRHRYESTLQGKARSGEDILTLNTVTNRFQSAWMDSFHMNYAVLFSEGPATENGFMVTGLYDVAPEVPRWGWKTVFEVINEDHVIITAYNVTPEGEEAKAVETDYRRVNSSSD